MVCIVCIACIICIACIALYCMYSFVLVCIICSACIICIACICLYVYVLIVLLVWWLYCMYVHSDMYLRVLVCMCMYCMYLYVLYVLHVLCMYCGPNTYKVLQTAKNKNSFYSCGVRTLYLLHREAYYSTRPLPVLSVDNSSCYIFTCNGCAGHDNSARGSMPVLCTWKLTFNVLNI